MPQSAPGCNATQGQACVKACAAGIGCAGAALADPAIGTWKTEIDDGRYAHVKMAPCAAGICGTIIKSFDANGPYNSPNVGKQIVRGMQAKGGGKYAGKVWRPSNQKIYTGKMQISGNALKLSGCVAGGLLCSKQTWTRLK